MIRLTTLNLHTPAVIDENLVFCSFVESLLPQVRVEMLLVLFTPLLMPSSMTESIVAALLLILALVSRGQTNSSLLSRNFANVCSSDLVRTAFFE